MQYFKQYFFCVLAVSVNFLLRERSHTVIFYYLSDLFQIAVEVFGTFAGRLVFVMDYGNIVKSAKDTVLHFTRSLHGKSDCKDMLVFVW